MPGLTLHGVPVKTVFDLLGDKEDDMTYSLGWALTHSETLTHRLLGEVFGHEVGSAQNIRLQEPVPGAGRTDVEIETARAHLIVEAKRAWHLPSDPQLLKYGRRFQSSRSGAIVVVSEASSEFAEPRLLKETDGIPVRYLPWRRIAELSASSAETAGLKEKNLLREFLHYLRGVMAMVNVRDNMVYVVSLSPKPLGQSTLSTKAILEERDTYFHPMGGAGGGWPKQPPNYLGFRFGGRLQQIRHVEGVDVVEPRRTGMPEIPELNTGFEWQDWPHFRYGFGPIIKPAQVVKTGRLWNARVWAALDLLLTSATVAEAADLTKRRLEEAGRA